MNDSREHIATLTWQIISHYKMTILWHDMFSLLSLCTSLTHGYSPSDGQESKIDGIYSNFILCSADGNFI